MIGLKEDRERERVYGINHLFKILNFPSELLYWSHNMGFEGFGTFRRWAWKRATDHWELDLESKPWPQPWPLLPLGQYKKAASAPCSCYLEFRCVFLLKRQARKIFLALSGFFQAFGQQNKGSEYGYEPYLETQRYTVISVQQAQTHPPSPHSYS